MNPEWIPYWIPFAQPVRYTYNHSPYRVSNGWMIGWRKDDENITYLTHDGFEVTGTDRLEFN